MHKEGHVGAALLVYSPLGLLAAISGAADLTVLGAVAAVGLAMLPDVDMRVPLVRHRGPTHTAWFALAVGAILGVLGGLRGAEAGVLAALAGGAFGLLVGTSTVCSHIAADALTPAGVRPWWPYRDRSYSYHVARASNPVANYALLALGVAATAAALAVADALG